MSQSELLITVTGKLTGARIPYMITGSIASSLQGEPRLTHDIDIVLAIQEGDIQDLIELFSPPRFLLDDLGLRLAVREKKMFNLLDNETGEKVDFWILTDDIFDQSRFGRKIQEEFEGHPIITSTPEDTILMKLRWAKLSGGSEKQFTDVLRVYEIQYKNLDLDYIEEWAAKLTVTELWNRIQEKGIPL